MSPNTQTHRHYHVVRHIVTFGSRGPKHRVARELTLIRIGGKPCLPNGIEVQLPRQHFKQFKARCRHDGQLMRYQNAVVSHDDVGNWKLNINPPPIVDDAMHLFDLYPFHDLDAVGVVANIPKKKPIAAALTSDGDYPVFFPTYGRGSCLFAPVRFGFSAEFRLNGAAGSEFQIHALTEPVAGEPKALKKENRTPSIVVRCGRDALKWLHREAPTAA